MLFFLFLKQNKFIFNCAHNTKNKVKKIWYTIINKRNVKKISESATKTPVMKNKNSIENQMKEYSN